MDATCYPALSGNVAYYNWRNAVRDAGTVSFNQTWYANLDYVVEGALTINAGATLTVQPGTAVKFNDTGSGIAVNGALVADGTAAQQIVFTSVRDQELGHDVLNLRLRAGSARIANPRLSTESPLKPDSTGQPRQSSSDDLAYQTANSFAGPSAESLAVAASLFRRPRHAGGRSRCSRSDRPRARGRLLAGRGRLGPHQLTATAATTPRTC